jgi:ribonucleoside-diphosphate reductase alpha chain
MGIVFQKNYISGESVAISHPVFHDRFKDEPWYTSDLLDKIANNYGSLKGIRGIPDEVRKVFVAAHDIKYKDRIDLQSEIQRYCSTAISSTVNLPKSVTKEEISDLYKYAWEKGLKGVTIYRDGSKKFQPVTFEKETQLDSEFKRPTRLHSETFIIETGNGKMYVTVSDYKGKPLEVFIYVGKSGQILNTFSEAIGRLISIAFQNGVPVETITKTLVGINSDKPTWYRFEETDKRPTQVLSIPDGIAQLLNRYYAGQKYEGELSGEICPKCGKEMRAIEGCFSCTCGHSKCS